MLDQPMADNAEKGKLLDEEEEDDFVLVDQSEQTHSLEVQNKALQAEIQDLKMENTAMLITLESLEKEICAAQAEQKGSDVADQERLDSKNAIIKQQEQDLNEMAKVVKQLEERLASAQQTLLQHTFTSNAQQPNQPVKQVENAQGLENLLERINELESQLASAQQASQQKQDLGQSDKASTGSKPGVPKDPGGSERSPSLPSEQNETATVRTLSKALEMQESMYRELEAELERERQRYIAGAPSPSPGQVMAEMHQQLDLAADRVAELETINDEANQNLSKERDRSAELDRKLQELTKSLEESKQLSEQNVTRAVAESAAKAEDEGKTLRETINLLEDKNTVLENDTLVAQTQVRELEGLVDEFKKKVADLEAELSNSKQEQNEQVQELSAETNGSTVQLESSNPVPDDAPQLEGSVDELQKRVADLELELQEARQLPIRGQDDSANYEQLLKESQLLVEKLSNDMNKYEQLLKEKEVEVEELTADISKLEQHLKETEDLLAATPRGEHDSLVKMASAAITESEGRKLYDDECDLVDCVMSACGGLIDSLPVIIIFPPDGDVSG